MISVFSGETSLGLAAARGVDPSVVYASPHYFSILWKLYIDLVLTRPLAVLHVYGVKLYYLLFTPLGGHFWGQLPSFLQMPISISSLFIVAYALLRRLESNYEIISMHEHYLIDCVFVISILFQAMFFLQGAIFHQSIQIMLLRSSSYMSLSFAQSCSSEFGANSSTLEGTLPSRK